MKKCRFYLVISLLSLTGCTDVKKSEEYRKVVFDRDSLMEVLDSKEKEVKELAREIDKIESNLSAIDSNKTKILKLSGNQFLPQKDRVHALIADIYIALDQNQTVLKSLEKKLIDQKGSQNFKLIVSTLKKTLQAKEEEILMLEKELANLKLEVINLQSAVAYKQAQLNQKDTLLALQDQKLQKQEALIAQKDDELHKVFYIRGTSKELESAGIIKKEGGIAGIGSVKILGEKLGGEKLKTLNSKQSQMLLIGRYKKKKVVSNHPSDSYFFIAKEGQFYLKISYPEKFWSLSKYLVVVVE